VICGMPYPEYERGTTIKISAEFLANGKLVDPLYPRVTVYKPDGTKLVDNAEPFKDEAGKYHYYIETSKTDPLGLYIVEWSGWCGLEGTLGSGQIIQRDVFSLVEVE